jgi:hypothetical protein
VGPHQCRIGFPRGSASVSASVSESVRDLGLYPGGRVGPRGSAASMLTVGRCVLVQVFFLCVPVLAWDCMLDC